MNSPTDSRSGGSAGEARALRILTEQLRDQAEPEIDFDRIERALLAQIDATPSEARTPVARRYSAAKARIFGGLALVVAVAAGGAIWVKQSASSGSLAGGPQALKAHRTIEATAADQRVVHPGVGAWVAEKGARVRVLEDAPDRVVLSLDEGTLLAEVIPRSIPDRFVVIAGHTRVSVRGTIFRVARDGDHVDVAVTRGAVAVGPEGGVASVSLVAPRSGSFTLDGQLRGETTFVLPSFDNPLLAVNGEHSGDESKTPVQLTAPGSNGGARAASDTSAQMKLSAPTLSASGRAVPSASKGATNDGATLDGAASDGVAVESAILDEANLHPRLTAIAAECFVHEAHVPPGVNVTATSVLMVTFDAAHHASSVAFRSPLAPAVEQCIRLAVSAEQGPTGAFETPLRLVTGD